MSNDQQIDLADRISEPVMPQEVARDIAVLEQQFIRAEVEQLRRNILDFRPLYEKRAKIIAHPEVQSNFWVRVLSNASGEIDQYITPADAAILGSALKDLKVERFEVNEKGEGEPRSIRLTFEFLTGDENPFFENEKLVKELYWRKQVFTTASGKKSTWDGLVSDPVRINWKKDMDVTKGLLDATCDLFEAEKKGGSRRDLPEFKKLQDKLVEVEALEVDEEEEENDDEDPLGQPSGQSFFNFFGYRGGDVTAEQSATATQEEEERLEKSLKGEKVEYDEADDDEDVDDDFDEIEAFPEGGQLAIALAEDLWPNALKYYTQSFEEMPDDFDMDELDDEDDEEEEEDEESHPRKKTKV
ncbi:histone chaperone napB [Aspergillus mulundensis]|uniref:Nucleosome assembly protein n=1 Tax=Aspergillus mulundensis TaxID=1810919 RepID=A0A3D8T4X3_9EURO|nr:Uncharacterized protein DSM5745_00380 [Aspergillus mulundensis]RDW93058.1 Uncharacterized protein DSM5745_00380 [Aspergillus mulundensis]